MIGFATPAGRSCVTVDACRRLCAGCTDSARSQHSGLAEIVCLYGRRAVAGPPAKMRRNTDERQIVGQTATSNK